MKKSTYLILFFLLLGAITIFLVTSRSEVEKTAREINQAFMEVKDEATYKVKRIEELNSSLEEVVAKLKNEEDQVHQKAIEEYNVLMQALTRSKKHITDWMNRVELESEKIPPQEVMAYLKAEQEKIYQINEEAEKAIKDAEEALDSRGEVVKYRESRMNEKHES